VKSEHTPYETDPVQNVGEALRALAHAYNRLQDALHAGPSPAWGRALGERLRRAVNRPVGIDGQAGRLLGLYEIGIAHAPDTGGGASAPAQLTVNDAKLSFALENRGGDLEVFFMKEEAGLLPRLYKMLMRYKNQAGSGDEAYAPLVRLINECRRLQAFWGQ
jgi:hypothetical protein